MTTGEKIRYCRQQLNITQSKLAELTGIHPVSIRKYETNKMQPLLPQIKRIAKALGVSSNALSGIADVDMPLETVGDLMGLLIVLCNSHILQINGERREDDMLDADTATISFNPVLSDFIEIRSSEKNTALNDILINIKTGKIFSDLLKWEKMNYIYTKNIQMYKDSQNENIQAALQEILINKEIFELELQRSPIRLDTSEGIFVKVNPDY